MRHLRLDRPSKWSDRASRSLAETMAKRRAEMEAEQKPMGDDPVSTSERAVIDAAVAWAASTGTEATLVLLDRVAELHAARKVKTKAKANP